MAAARRKGWPVHEEQPIDLVAPEADVRNVPEDVISVRGSEVDDASTVTSSNQDDTGSSSDSSDDSSTTDEPAPSVASEDHNMLMADLCRRRTPVADAGGCVCHGLLPSGGSQRSSRASKVGAGHQCRSEGREAVGLCYGIIGILEYKA